MSLTRDFEKALVFYSENVMEWNKCFNLTSCKSCDDFYNNHIIDSIAILPVLKEYLNKFQNKRIEFADFGTGAGIPIIPLYISLLDFNISFYSVDQNHKRCVFLKDIVLKLQKKFFYNNNFTVVEKQIKQIKKKFDIITFCALSPLDKIERLLFDTLNDSGYVFAYKGEISKTEKEVKSLSLFNAKIIKLNSNNKERCVVILNKK